MVDPSYIIGTIIGILVIGIVLYARTMNTVNEVKERKEDEKKRKEIDDLYKKELEQRVIDSFKWNQVEEQEKS